ncbi:putative MATE family efflux protein [Tenacibaculum skagerrakense]|uniref:Multidrug export protein MepA n=1 Tax=Tenacibaculum skagerrakense TaxID=186571 RepID=A0A4R2NWD3_9FLAO|nr:MATE family efflux transporter [Tenacibaculum skagerrakense]TCP25928.1 putative MATE family efflux protein [Tenacibaculum skagerrakense]
MNQIANELSTEKVSKLLLKQSIPAAIGILVMSINMIVDTIFVGQWIGVLAIAAITVVLPIGFLISSIGMAIGIGGSSVISLALGADNVEKAKKVFGNQFSLTTLSSIFLVTICLLFEEHVLKLFGANGNILAPAIPYFRIIIIGAPFLAFAMMGNPIIRALGKPTYAMIALILPAIANILLDIVFIKIFDWGMFGAGLATSIAYAVCGLFILGFLLSKKSNLKIGISYLKLEKSIVSEISSLGSITLVRQGTVSILTIILNYSLFKYGNESSVAVFGIINRLMMFIFFPVFGIVQGFLPIAGYNYGANLYGRVKEVLYTANKYGTIICVFIFLAVYFFNYEMTSVFTNDANLLNQTPNAILTTLLATPFIAFQLVGASYFQAVGKAKPALVLTLLRQSIFLIPFLIVLPMFFGLEGIWFSFPIADLLATIVTYIYVRKEIQKLSLTSSHHSDL